MSNLVYLVSSLPSLTFGQTPPMSLDSFLSESKEQLSSTDFDALIKLDLKNFDETKGENLKQFRELLAQLNADILEVRNAKANQRTATIQTLSKTVFDQNPLEREISIMKWQWEELTNIDFGENFSFTVVLVYKLKLQILHRLNSFNSEKGLGILESVVKPPKKMEEM
jgi:hypothetical protein